MATKKKAQTPKARKTPASIVWFEIPTDDLKRAQQFYGSLFGWTFNKLPAAVND